MLFVHDHTFINKDNKFYTTGSLNGSIMSRYKEWFGKVEIFATTRKFQEKDSVYIKKENEVNNVKFKLVEKKNSIFHIIKQIPQLRKEVKVADCVVSRMSIYGSIAVLYAKKYSVPCLVEMVACPWDSLWYHSAKGKILAPFMTLYTKYIVSKADNVLYVTNEFLQERYPCKGNIIGCSDVELKEVNLHNLENRIVKIKNIKDIKRLTITTVANIGVKYKGQELVIKAISALKKLGYEYKYNLIGGGNSVYLKKVVKKYGVEDNVNFIGPVPHNEVFDYLKETDLYIQPSFQEGLPRAVIEAMSMGCPIIGSNAGGIPELIENEFVFNKGNYKELESILKNISIDKLLLSAKINFNKSKQYEKNYLDKKRSEFYSSFYQRAKSGENNG